MLMHALKKLLAAGAHRAKDAGVAQPRADAGVAPRDVLGRLARRVGVVLAELGLDLRAGWSSRSGTSASSEHVKEEERRTSSFFFWASLLMTPCLISHPRMLCSSKLDDMASLVLP